MWNKAICFGWPWCRIIVSCILLPGPEGPGFMWLFFPNVPWARPLHCASSVKLVGEIRTYRRTYKMHARELNGPCASKLNTAPNQRYSESELARQLIVQVAGFKCRLPVTLHSNQPIAVKRTCQTLYSPMENLLRHELN